jgi:hypothetical protein
MEITRNVILDLLPLYLAGEASAETNALVKKFLENDPELADIAKRSVKAELPGDIPIPLTTEDKMETYKEAKRLIYQRIIVLAAIISASALFILIMAVIAYFFFKG